MCFYGQKGMEKTILFLFVSKKPKSTHVPPILENFLIFGIAHYRSAILCEPTWPLAPTISQIVGEHWRTLFTRF